MYNIDEREQQVNEQEGKNETKETVEESLWVEGQEADLGTMNNFFKDRIVHFCTFTFGVLFCFLVRKRPHPGYLNILSVKANH